ncbi:hypothetical protein REPUB_Repub01dG0183200 [Reevesia pubescens]
MIRNLIEMEERVDIERVSTSEKGQISRTIATRSVVNGVPNQGNRPQSNNEIPVLAGGTSSTRTWGISSIFGRRASSVGTQAIGSPGETLHEVEDMSSTIQLREPLSVLRPLEMSKNKATEIIITKLLMQSYFDIVRKNIQDLVPKTIMHFLVNHTKRNLHNTFVQILYQYVSCFWLMVCFKVYHVLVFNLLNRDNGKRFFWHSIVVPSIIIQYELLK